MKCKICDSLSEKIFEKTILQKYNTGYYKCTQCNFIQTEDPFWLKEAYASAITSLDIGLLYRNNYLKKEISKIIDCCFPKANMMIDYAGGYGVFVRLMRDAGYNFYRQDNYCKNIFAEHFDITDTPTKKFDLVTAFEVLEHFNDPLNEIEAILKYADNAIFTTEIAPKDNQDIENWWYIAQETGQHIAFYSEDTMEIIAKKFNKYYYTKDKTLHLFTSQRLEDYKINYVFRNIEIKTSFFGLIKKKIKFKIKRDSLLQDDYQYVKSLLNSKQ